MMKTIKNASYIIGAIILIIKIFYKEDISKEFSLFLWLLSIVLVLCIIIIEINIWRK